MTSRAAKTPAAPGVRGRHADRSAAMRHRLVDTAVLCLNRVGYASTTTEMVRREARVSRGAMLHHFPTKIDLLMAVAEHAANAQDALVRQRLAGTPEGMDRYLAITGATWEATCRPPGIAFIEIFMASRSDVHLGERLRSVVERFEARQREDVWTVAFQTGIRDRDAVERMVRLHTAALRGLIMERLFTGRHGPAEASVELLQWYKRSLTAALITKAGDPLFARPTPAREGGGSMAADVPIACTRSPVPDLLNELTGRSR